MARKRKSKVSSKTSKTKAPTKVSQVIALCQRKGGITLVEIVKALGVSTEAGRSLINDARAKGMKIKFDNGVYGIK